MKRLVAALIVFVAVAAPVLAQQPSPASRPRRVDARSTAPPRAADGHPSFEGVWRFSTVTPLQRPAELADKARFASPEEAAAYAKRAALNLDRPPTKGDPGAYNQFWIDAGDSVTKSLRTALIVDPPDGRIPPLTPEGEKRLEAMRAGQKRIAGPEDFTTYERCILGFNAGPPIVPGPYNNMLQILQTSDHVVLLTEMVHDARLIPVKAASSSANSAAAISQWRGQSIGHWDGDTLVIESRHFRAEGTGTISFRPATDANLKLTERLRRVDRDTLEYSFTIDDSTVWTKPWTALVEMVRTDEQIYEYACHEGNTAMTGMLGGARAAERSGQTAR